MHEPQDAILEDLRSEDVVRHSRVFNRVYEELRSIARHYVRGDRAAAALQPTDLVNEACLKLLPSGALDQITQRRFLGFAARAMRQILTDQARKDGADKRGGDWRRITLTDLAEGGGGRSVRLLALESAMTRLEAEDAHLAELVELHYIGGMTGDQLAEHYGVSRRTLTRDLAFARAQLLASIDRFEADHA